MTIRKGETIKEWKIRRFIYYKAWSLKHKQEKSEYAQWYRRVHRTELQEYHRKYWLKNKKRLMINRVKMGKIC